MKKSIFISFIVSLVITNGYADTNNNTSAHSKSVQKSTKISGKMPTELQKLKDIVEAKVTVKSKPLEGNVKKIFEKLLKEKNNSNFTLDEAQEIINDDKDAAMVLLAYTMGKSIAIYNQMTPAEKKAFDKKNLAEMTNKTDKKKEKELVDKYLKEHPEEIRKLGFSFLEDITKNGIPQVDFNMK